MYNVMIVDDELRSIDAIERNVEWVNCGINRVYRAMNMEQALEIADREQIQILICDIEMPNGSGLDLLEALIQRKKEIGCIFVTCHPEFPYMRRAIQLRCYDYILKPIDYEEFTRVLKDLVHRLEAKEAGADNLDALNWGGITDAEIQSLGRRERNVEREVKTYIREHMMDNINVAEIAQALHFNPQYLMRAFKNKTGLSILEYITLTRLDTAKKILLDTQLPIREVSQMVGYADYAYFTRVFRREVGMTPSQYRSQSRGGKNQQGQK